MRTDLQTSFRLFVSLLILYGCVPMSSSLRQCSRFQNATKNDASVMCNPMNPYGPEDKWLFGEEEQKTEGVMARVWRSELPKIRPVDSYDVFLVDALHVYRLWMYTTKPHHFVAVRAIRKGLSRPEVFVFEFPVPGCFGSQNIRRNRSESSTVGFVTKPGLPNERPRLTIRVLKYTVPSDQTLAAGYEEDAHPGVDRVHSTAIRIEDESFEASLSKLVSCETCSRITIKDLMLLAQDIIRDRTAFVDSRRYNTPWQMGFAWANSSVPPWRKDEVKAAMRDMVTAGERARKFEMPISDRSFAFMLAYAVDALAENRLSEAKLT